VSGSANKLLMVSCPSKAKAASVGANTVKLLLVSANVASNPVACNAVTNVVKLPSLTAASTIVVTLVTGGS